MPARRNIAFCSEVTEAGKRKEEKRRSERKGESEREKERIHERERKKTKGSRAGKAFCVSDVSLSSED